jgi:DNA processing protein
MGDDPDGRGAITREQEAWLRLCHAPGVGAAELRRLHAAFGSAAAVLEAPLREVREQAGEPIASAIEAARSVDWPEHTRRWLSLPDCRLVAAGEPNYPASLSEIHDWPPLLYVVGRARLLSAPSIAVVGSRTATAQGMATARAFARALSDAGLSVVSGLALGIDAAAHRGGLDGASASVAVLGTGPDLVYPSTNRALAHELARLGALVSEFPPGLRARPDHFPRRNRIISGLAHGCLVVEAGLDSGSLITARLALEQGREVFAIPGSIHSPVSKGCHLLIKQGAKLVESVDDILEELRFVPVALPAARASGTAADSGLRWPGAEPADADALAAASGLTHAQVSAILLRLEITGEVACLPGGRYQRIFPNH